MSSKRSAVWSALPIFRSGVLPCRPIVQIQLRGVSSYPAFLAEDLRAPILATDAAGRAPGGDFLCSVRAAPLVASAITASAVPNQKAIYPTRWHASRAGRSTIQTLSDPATCIRPSLWSVIRRQRSYHGTRLEHSHRSKGPRAPRPPELSSRYARASGCESRGYV